MSKIKPECPFRYYRKLKGWSQDDAAKELVCSVQTIKKLDSGKVSHQGYWIRKRAIDKLGVNDSELFSE